MKQLRVIAVAIIAGLLLFGFVTPANADDSTGDPAAVTESTIWFVSRVLIWHVIDRLAPTTLVTNDHVSPFFSRGMVSDVGIWVLIGYGLRAAT